MGCEEHPADSDVLAIAYARERFAMHEVSMALRCGMAVVSSIARRQLNQANKKRRRSRAEQQTMWPLRFLSGNGQPSFQRVLEQRAFVERLSPPKKTPRPRKAATTEDAPAFPSQRPSGDPVADHPKGGDKPHLEPTAWPLSGFHTGRLCRPRANR